MDALGGKQSAFRAKTGAERDQTWTQSLFAKGVLAFMLFALYIVVTGVAITVLRVELLDSLEELEAVYQRAEHLTEANAATTQALLEVTTASYGATDLVLTPTLSVAVQASVDSLRKVGAEYPPAARWADRVARGLHGLRQGGARSSWIEMRETLQAVRTDIHEDLEKADERTAELRNNFVGTFNLVAGTWVIAGVAGLVILGGAIGMFFARLARDVRRVEARAGLIVAGYRGAPLGLQRADEVGSLATAVDRMAEELRERELRLEVERQAKAYSEKMLALGAFAAGVAHEVNNPLMAIAGHARSLAESGAGEAAKGILAEVSRASTATRRLASLAAVQPEEFEWIDLNDLLQRTLGLMQYDQRYRAIRWNVSLQANLPAVRSVASRLQQVLATLLTLAADAIYLGGDLTLTSREAGEHVEIEIVDTRGEAAARAAVARLTQERDTRTEDDQSHALALANAVVDELGARMTVTVTGSGLGTIVALESVPEDDES